MNPWTMLAIFLGATVFIAAVSLLSLRSSGVPMSADIKTGAILQALLLGAIIGFLFVPNAPAPPQIKGGFAFFVLAIVLLEVTRNGLLVHLPFTPKSLCRYRIAALQAKRRSLDKKLAMLERLAAR